ncbi:uncharacterized protein [Parasteatoda tepidariorum]|uniref:uncharacterized protein n=1 Tax=Parasteatoda tepidariorum TaxID=114398 RepID=UPI001C720020|nr:fibulin-5-like [Parasteatoda tepidariorum]
MSSMRACMFPSKLCKIFTGVVVCLLIIFFIIFVYYYNYFADDFYEESVNQNFYFNSNINYCSNEPCPLSATCVNTDGSYSCVCNEGYKANGSDIRVDGCVDINECEESPAICPSQTKCVNIFGAFACVNDLTPSPVLDVRNTLTVDVADYNRRLVAVLVISSILILVVVFAYAARREFRKSLEKF